MDIAQLYAELDLQAQPDATLRAQADKLEAHDWSAAELATGCDILDLNPRSCSELNHLDSTLRTWAGIQITRLCADDFDKNEVGVWPDPLLHHDLARACLAAVLVSMPTLITRYQQRGVQPETLTAVTADIRRWIEAYQRRHDVLGLREIRWLRYHFAAELIPLGRLQFNPVHWFGACALGALELSEGQACFATHIPATGPLEPEQVAASFALAARELPRLWPARADNLLTCVSWLLDPRLRTMLKPGSNLLAFQAVWDAIVARKGEDRSILSFIFDRDVPPTDLSEVVATTSLQRAVWKHYQNGNYFTGGIGVRRLQRQPAPTP